MYDHRQFLGLNLKKNDLLLIEKQVQTLVDKASLRSEKDPRYVYLSFHNFQLRKKTSSGQIEVILLDLNSDIISDIRTGESTRIDNKKAAKEFLKELKQKLHWK